MIIDIIAGARPNFMKIAPLLKTINQDRVIKKKYKIRLIHTGQHYDKNMSHDFFKDLEIQLPDHNLGCKSMSRTRQIDKIMIEYEKILLKKASFVCIVVGDVNSTIACALTAKKMGIKIIHIEAGLRSGDLSMPEEINRIMTDFVSDYFFTTSRDASMKLIKEGNNKKNIFFVGNLMIDTLKANIKKARKPLNIERYILEKKYIILTIHRAENVSDQKQLVKLVQSIAKINERYNIIFPAHPRLRKKLNTASFPKNLFIIKPQSYLSFLYLIKNAEIIITDSGGITEEASILDIPCLTLRETTERPETVTLGTNILVGTDIDKLSKNLRIIFKGKWKRNKKIEKWDGNTSKRILKILKSIL